MQDMIQSANTYRQLALTDFTASLLSWYDGNHSDEVRRQGAIRSQGYINRERVR